MNTVSKIFAFGLILTLVMSELAVLVSMYSEANMEQLVLWEKHGDSSDEKDKSESNVEDNCDDKIALSGIEPNATQNQRLPMSNWAVANIVNFHPEVLTPPPDKA